MRNDFESNYLEHWGLKKGAQKKDHKYVARIELPNGKYRYFYTLGEYAAYLKDKAIERLKNFNKNKEELIAKKVNEGVKKVETTYNKIDKENKYLTDDYNYDKKIAKVKKTKEWQDIVKRKDPEYVYKNKKGETVYDVDSYLAKKKHPALDIADDVIMGRPVKINKIENEALVAGAADYGKTYITMAAIGTKFLLEKFKFSQGSYKDKKQQAVDYYNENKDKITKQAAAASAMMTDENTQRMVSEGEKYISQAMKEYGNSPTVSDISSIKDSVSKEDYEYMKKEYESYKQDYEAMKRELEKYKNAKQ
jgi:hypothetical protein